MTRMLDRFPFYPELDLTTPMHGDRPFELAHLDHTQLEIELTSSLTGENMGKPWWTILTDSFSRRILAIFLSFDTPSCRSSMLVLRECVNQHQRIPDFLLMNSGKEFDSAYFDQLQERLGFTTLLRPPKQPGSNSICERLFGYNSRQLIHNIANDRRVAKCISRTAYQVPNKVSR